MTRHPFAVVRVASVTSTQREARERANSGCRSGTVVLAEEQTAGRGRGSNSWFSSKGDGIWLTLVHRSRRPIAEWPSMTSVAALAVCRALEDNGLSPLVKWPNDVLISGKKIAGVLAESYEDAILIGIGINLLQDEGDFPDELLDKATSVRIESRHAAEETDLGIEPFLEILLPRLAADLESVERSGPRATLDSVWERSVIRDCFVELARPDGEMISGRAAGLGAIGDLLIDTDKGHVSVANGTVIGWRGA